MNYTILSEEAYKLYTSFCNVCFTDSQAFELTKFCIKEFPVFKEMIKEEDTYI